MRILQFCQSGVRRVSVALLALLLPATPPVRAFDVVAVIPGQAAEVGISQIQEQDAGWALRGRLRLLSAPLPRSNPGRVVLEVLAADGRVLAGDDAVVYRVVTANRRARIYGFRGTLPGGLPDDAVLRVRHLSAQ